MSRYKIEPGEVDLAAEDIRDSKDHRITPEFAEEMAEHALSVVRARRSGRPSLSGGEKHSPRVSFRMPEELAGEVEARAQEEGVSVSTMARRALEAYLKAS